MSNALTPLLVREFESRIQSITTGDYARLAANTWWQLVAKKKTGTSKKDVFAWLIENAMIRDTGKSGGKVTYDDLVAAYTEIESRHAGAGLRVTKDQLTDLFNGEPGGEAFQLGAEWARQIGAYMAYWPQKQIANFLMKAHLAPAAGGFNAYDGQIFFSAAHPLNPYDDAAGTFANLLSGTAYAIDTSVTLDVAATNFAKVWGHAKSIKAANGEDPRGLTLRHVIVPPKMFPRSKQLFEADFIAQAAAAGGGSADFKAFLSAMGSVTPICADELAGFETDASYFVVCEQLAGDQLGGVVYLEREAFRMSAYGDLSSAELSRLKMLEWLLDGRNATSGGHPYLIIKVKGT